MRWFEPIACNNTRADPYVANAADLGQVEDWELCDAIEVKNWSSSSWVRATTKEYDGAPDDVLQTFMALVPIYSPRLRRLLDRAHVRGIQYLPLHVVRPDASEIDGYAVANVLNRVPALDLARSRYSVFPPDWVVEARRGQIWTIGEAVLRQEALAGYEVVRLAENPSHLFVSENFKRAFDEGNCSGYSFKEIRLS